MVLEPVAQSFSRSAAVPCRSASIWMKPLKAALLRSTAARSNQRTRVSMNALLFFRGQATIWKKATSSGAATAQQRDLASGRVFQTLEKIRLQVGHRAGRHFTEVHPRSRRKAFASPCFPGTSATSQLSHLLTAASMKGSSPTRVCDAGRAPPRKSGHSRSKLVYTVAMSLSATSSPNDARSKD